MGLLSHHHHHHRPTSPSSSQSKGGSRLPRRLSRLNAGADRQHHHTRSTTMMASNPDWVFDVVFIGTGQSSSVPLVKHVLGGEASKCNVCTDAFTRPGSKNKRNNVSVAILKRPKHISPGDQHRCVLIDCGKTFREAIFKSFIPNGIREIDSLLITHGHADAILGEQAKNKCLSSCRLMHSSSSLYTYPFSLSLQVWMI